MAHKSRQFTNTYENVYHYKITIRLLGMFHELGHSYLCKCVPHEYVRDFPLASIPTCLSDSTPAVSALLRKNLILSGCRSFSLSVDTDNTYSINIPMDYEYTAYVVKSDTILSYTCT